MAQNYHPETPMDKIKVLGIGIIGMVIILEIAAKVE
tara:strand:- start:1560 stop:1667 length:108 start_codon:yes stop_codon:yes gene_type:complete